MLNDPQFEQIRPLLERSQSFGIVGNIITLALSGVTLFGGLKMKNLENYGLAMAASIIAIIPCFGPCCCIGIPVGIWSLVVLNKPEVKSAFR
jgi:predicted PurR-regulated permease PerM